MVRPIKQLIWRNYKFAKNEKENNILNHTLKIIIIEPKYSEIIKELIGENIKGKKTSTLEDMDKVFKEEYFERLYKNYNINKK